MARRSSIYYEDRNKSTLKKCLKTVDYQHMTEYQRYLKSTLWAKLKVKVLARDGHKCVTCGNKTRLHVHHIHYRNCMRENLEDLQTLCQKCHEKVHGIVNGKKPKVARKRKSGRCAYSQRW